MPLPAPFIEDQEEEKYTSVYQVSGQGHGKRAVDVSCWHVRVHSGTSWIPSKRSRVPEIISWPQTDEATSIERAPNSADPAPEAYRILRLGILLLVCLVPIGVGLLSLAGPIGAALGFSFLYAGVLVVLVTQYAFGLKTGYFAIGPRYSVLGIIAFLGLVMTSFVAAIERLS
jgi:hypothetical protein